MCIYQHTMLKYLRVSDNVFLQPEIFNRSSDFGKRRHITRRSSEDNPVQARFKLTNLEKIVYC